MSQLIEPLRKYWSNLVLELVAAIENNYDPTRVGEVLAQELLKLIEKLENEQRKKSDELFWKAKHREQELTKNVDQLTREKNGLSREIQIIQDRNEDLAKQVRIQNSLIADLHRQISNLTGATDQASST